MSLKSILQLSAVGAGILLLLAALAGLAYMNRPPTQLEKIVSAEKVRFKVYDYMVGGCAAAGSHDDNFKKAFMMTGGNVCIQVLGMDLQNQAYGTGPCKQDDLKCLFDLGYTITAMRGLKRAVDTSEDVDQLEQSIKEDYDKILATQQEAK